MANDRRGYQRNLTSRSNRCCRTSLRRDALSGTRDLKQLNHWSGVVALVGGDFSIGQSKDTAIVNDGHLYLRDVKTRGFAKALSNNSAMTIPNGDISEFSSDPVMTLHEGTPTASPRLPIKVEPNERETDHSKWLCANDFGITVGDGKDDSSAFQAAFDEAARLGATTVFIRGVPVGPRMWHNLEKEVRIHGSVQHVIALGLGRILGDGDDGGFVVDDSSAKHVTFRHIDSLGGQPIKIINRSSNRTMHVESCGVHIVGDGGGDIFATNVATRLRLLRAGQSCWIRVSGNHACTSFFVAVWSWRCFNPLN